MIEKIRKAVEDLNHLDDDHPVPITRTAAQTLAKAVLPFIEGIHEKTAHYLARGKCSSIIYVPIGTLRVFLDLAEAEARERGIDDDQSASEDSSE